MVGEQRTPRLVYLDGSALLGSRRFDTRRGLDNDVARADHNRDPAPLRGIWGVVRNPVQAGSVHAATAHLAVGRQRIAPAERGRTCVLVGWTNMVAPDVRKRGHVCQPAGQRWAVGAGSVD